MKPWEQNTPVIKQEDESADVAPQEYKPWEEFTPTGEGQVVQQESVPVASEPWKDFTPTGLTPQETSQESTVYGKIREAANWAGDTYNEATDRMWGDTPRLGEEGAKQVVDAQRGATIPDYDKLANVSDPEAVARAKEGIDKREYEPYINQAAKMIMSNPEKYQNMSTVDLARDLAMSSRTATAAELGTELGLEMTRFGPFAPFVMAGKRIPQAAKYIDKAMDAYDVSRWKRMGLEATKSAGSSVVAGEVGNVVAGREAGENMGTNAAWGALGGAVAGSISPSRSAVSAQADEFTRTREAFDESMRAADEAGELRRLRGLLEDEAKISEGVGSKGDFYGTKAEQQMYEQGRKEAKATARKMEYDDIQTLTKERDEAVKQVREESEARLKTLREQRDEALSTQTGNPREIRRTYDQYLKDEGESVARELEDIATEYDGYIADARKLLAEEGEDVKLGINTEKDLDAFINGDIGYEDYLSRLRGKGYEVDEATRAKMDAADARYADDLAIEQATVKYESDIRMSQLRAQMEMELSTTADKKGVRERYGRLIKEEQDATKATLAEAKRAFDERRAAIKAQTIADEPARMDIADARSRIRAEGAAEDKAARAYTSEADKITGQRSRLTEDDIARLRAAFTSEADKQRIDEMARYINDTTPTSSTKPYGEFDADVYRVPPSTTEWLRDFGGMERLDARIAGLDEAARFPRNDRVMEEIALANMMESGPKGFLSTDLANLDNGGVFNKLGRAIEEGTWGGLPSEARDITFRKELNRYSTGVAEQLDEAIIGINNELAGRVATKLKRDTLTEARDSMNKLRNDILDGKELDSDALSRALPHLSAEGREMLTNMIGINQYRNRYTPGKSRSSESGMRRLFGLGAGALGMATNAPLYLAGTLSTPVVREITNAARKGDMVSANKISKATVETNSAVRKVEDAVIARDRVTTPEAEAKLNQIEAKAQELRVEREARAGYPDYEALRILNKTNPTKAELKKLKDLQKSGKTSITEFNQPKYDKLKKEFRGINQEISRLKREADKFDIGKADEALAKAEKEFLDAQRKYEDVMRKIEEQYDYRAVAGEGLGTWLKTQNEK